MAVPEPERRLAAVLAADMVGYSRLMEVDEAGTLARLKTDRLELIDPAIAKRRGRIIKTTGDGCCSNSQRRRRGPLRCRNPAPDGPTNIDVRRRGGCSFASASIWGRDLEDGDIFGDGVNVAARLEMLAEPGGICVSGAVRDQVGDRLEDISFEDLGDQSVKNIARPIHVFRIRLDPGRISPRRRARRTCRGSDTIAKKPSVAVLPLVNMSGDPEQDSLRTA